MLDSPRRDSSRAGSERSLHWPRASAPRGRKAAPPHSMEPQVTLNVTFKNETQSFLVSDPENTTWADVEAMMANIKQGNLLQMQVHEGYHVVDEAFPQTVVEKPAAARTGKKPLAHYSSLVRVLGSDMKTTEEPAAQPRPLTPCDTKELQDKPPDWFTSYLETFREQVVKETVEKLEQRLWEKLVLQKSASEASIPVSKNQFNWHIACTQCRKRIMGVRYQCSVCPAYNICEDCEAGPYAHSRSHVLLKFRRPTVIPSDPFSHLKGPPPRLPASLEQIRIQKQVDKNFVKAEKQRLRAEKKQRKAEVKELKKQLKLHRKIHLWNSIHGLQSPKYPLGRAESLLQSNTLMLPLQPCAPVMPTLSAAFVDENLPDGTHLQPGTKFIKHWRMKNTGNVKWSTDTKDLLSFELLDINIVQELERVPHNTPVDSTLSAKRKAEAAASLEETEEDLSGTQFVCETVIRSLTLDAAPDHNPPCRQRSPQRELQLQSTEEQQPVVLPGFCRKDSSLKFALPGEGPLGDEREEIVHIAEEEEEELQDEVQSQSSASSEDYIIILPECFDTSRPLGDSMYSSALSQPGLERGAEGEPGIEAGQEPTEAGEKPPEGESQPREQSISDILTTSQTLDTVPLVPEVVGLPPPLSRSSPCQHGSPGVDSPVTIQEIASVPDQIRGEPRGSSGLVNSRQRSYDHSRHHSGSSIAGGLVKGALSVAASAYKALFSGPPVTAQPIASEDQTAALMAHLFEMGFCDRQLNLRLLRKHNYNILQVVTELLHINNNDWYSHRY
ncbi:hypothetical protein A6R68_04527 [Neotoma lepida]|uniref:ZZ-type domain-containing protein n=1 Tax=Neotoma lepida TaxID=56216 RepID=A0A1A6GKY1_NEOLE|nr:hypothetical protein A6R68_04527 [Neotoma lepida]